MVKLLNSQFFNSINFWDNRYFNSSKVDFGTKGPGETEELIHYTAECNMDINGRLEPSNTSTTKSC